MANAIAHLETTRALKRVALFSVTCLAYFDVGGTGWRRERRILGLVARAIARLETTRTLKRVELFSVTCVANVRAAESRILRYLAMRVRAERLSAFGAWLAQPFLAALGATLPALEIITKMAFTRAFRHFGTQRLSFAHRVKRRAWSKTKGVVFVQ